VYKMLACSGDFWTFSSTPPHNFNIF
jgi:hypothetical protein